MTATRLPIDYIEFTSPSMEDTQTFFAAAFGWTFEDYGPDYRDIAGAGTGGGLERGAARAPSSSCGPMTSKAPWRKCGRQGARSRRRSSPFPVAAGSNSSPPAASPWPSGRRDRRTQG